MPKCLNCNSSVISAEVICDRCRGDFVKVVRCRECSFYERVAGVDVCVRKNGSWGGGRYGNLVIEGLGLA